MEGLKTAVSYICVSLIFLGVMSILLPEGTMKKVFKSFAATAVIAATVAAIKGTDFGNIAKIPVSTDTAVDSALLQSVEAVQCRAAESAVARFLTERLTSAGVEAPEIYSKADISENGDIYISELTVICSYGECTVCEKILDELSLKGEVGERDKNGSESDNKGS